jgi:amino acid transporter
MSEDNLYLLFCYLLFGITLAILSKRSKSRQKTLLKNLIISVLYSTLFLYNLIYNSSEGSGLVWLVYLMFFIGIHWLINLIGLILTFTKKSKRIQ